MEHLTKNEAKLNELINEMNEAALKNEFTPQRDWQLIHALQAVSTLSQDGELEQLNELIEENFPDYGQTGCVCGKWYQMNNK